MKNRIVAALFALFLGSFGVHKFYLRDPGAGIFYIILMMIGSSMRLPISAFLGFIDALVLFTMSDEKFDKKYNKKYENRRHRNRDRRDNDRYSYREQRRYGGSDRRSYSREQYKGRSSRSSRPRGSYEVRREEYRRPKPKSQPERRPPRRPRENPFKKTGISKYKEFDLEGAIEDFNKGLELDPKDMALHFNIACAYSLTEQPEKSFHHISKAVENGIKDFEKIKTHDDLAFMRIQDKFEEFQKNGYRLNPVKEIPISGPENEEEIEVPDHKDKAPEDLIQDDVLLSQLQKLSELRKKGLLSEKEYSIEREKLMRR